MSNCKEECHLPPMREPIVCRRCLGRGTVPLNWGRSVQLCTRCGGEGKTMDVELWERLADHYEHGPAPTWHQQTPTTVI